ncbi:MAG: PilW family protein [Oleiphilaceae bacterium]|nr:PilW family protein [Oleiphilaceae bacterium]
MRTTPIRIQTGLSMVELMVALLLAGVLTTGLVQIFTSNSQTFRLNEASARIQESGRLASDILARAVRNADYWGCSRPGGDAGQVRSMLNDTTDFNFDNFTSGLAGASHLDDTNIYDAVTRSDVVTFGGIDGNAVLSTTEQTPNNSATIFTGEDPTGLLFDGEIILISDCRAADMFQITNVRTNGVTANTGGTFSPGNATQTQSDYDAGAVILRPMRQSFYVRENDTGERFLVFNPVQVQDTSSTTVGEFEGPIELVSHIRDLRIQFGAPSGSGTVVDTWRRPGQAVGDDNPSTQGEEVADDALAVRFSFLVRSPQDNVLEDPQSYCFPGWLDCEGDSTLLTTATDRHLYRVYTLTASMRNRLE